MFFATVKSVKLEVRPLFLPQLVRLTSMLRPGLTNINVSSYFYRFITFYVMLVIYWEKELFALLEKIDF